jgi:hypothetical protein
VGENILEANVRYHCPVHGILNIQKVKNTVFRRRVWDYEKGNYDQFCEDLGNVEWDRLIHESHLNDAVSIVSDEILKAAGNNIPNKFIVIRSEDPPWMNGAVRK